jgi:hypothetical protein
MPMKQKIYVSFLIPTRLRTKLLEKSLISIKKNSIEKNTYEIILCVDDDDIETIQWANKNIEQFNLKLIITSRKGYNKLHEYYNIAAKQSSGEWLWLWNDDAEIISKNWDLVLKKYSNRCLILNPGYRENYTYKYRENESFNKFFAQFPILSRKIYEKLGYFSAWNHADSYIDKLSKDLYIFRYEPKITIIHKTSPNTHLYHAIPFPVDIYNKDIQFLKDYFGKKVLILNFTKSFFFFLIYFNIARIVRRIKLFVQNKL